MATWLRRTRAVAHYLRRSSGRPSSSRVVLDRQGAPLPAVPPLGSVGIRGAAGRISPAPFPVFSAKRLESTRAEKHHLVSVHEAEDDDTVEDDDDDDDAQVLDFPGGKVAFTSRMQFIAESAEERVPCYRVLDDYGQQIENDCSAQVNEELAVKMYTDMVTLQIMDAVFFEAQRQGRISFYLTSMGEEAINIASAAALTDDDVVMPQYREQGVLLWRGFTLQEFANQCFGNKVDYGKGRQMPIHYGSNKHNYFTVSSPIATQIPQAVGAAHSLKMDKRSACVAAYFGDGSTSEGDFHAGLNFAAVMEAPVIFICRNNGWAISTHTREQFRSDGIVVRGQAYGIRSIRVDGNDALAVYSAVREAREMAIKDQMPILVEALTYRVGHHSTSAQTEKVCVDIEQAPVDDDPRQWSRTRKVTRSAALFTFLLIALLDDHALDCFCGNYGIYYVIKYPDLYSRW